MRGKKRKKILPNFVDFKMAANENALTQPKFELGITGIIQNVVRDNYTTKQKIEKLLKTQQLFSLGGGRGVGG